MSVGAMSAMGISVPRTPRSDQYKWIVTQIDPDCRVHVFGVSSHLSLPGVYHIHSITKEYLLL